MATYPTLPIWPGATYTVTSFDETILTGINDDDQTSGDASAYCQPSYSDYASGCTFAVEGGLGGASPQVLGEIPIDQIDIDCEYDDFYSVLTYAISNDGTVYGYACWNGGNPVAMTGTSAPTALQNWPAGGSIEQNDVNATGEIATNGYLWDNGSTQPLTGPDGSTLDPVALNDNNVAVGSDDESDAVIWTDQGSTTLQDLTDGEANGSAVITGIDDNGDIVGYQYHQNHEYAFLAVPGVPKVTSVDPTGGPMTGGQTVTVTGSDFTDASAVDFTTAGGTSVAATSINVDSDTEITATTPDLTSSAGGQSYLPTAVSVTGPDGSSSSALTEDDQYEFGAPVVTAVVPAGGPSTGGNTVEIEGSGFANPQLVLDQVNFVPQATDDNSLPGVNAQVVSDSEIEVTAPNPAAANEAGVTATDLVPSFYLGQYDTVDAQPLLAGDNSYSFGTPTITSIDPIGGPLQGGNLVQINGTGFQSEGLSLVGLTFDTGGDEYGGGTDLPGIDPTVVSDTEIDVTAPDASAYANGDTLATVIDADFAPGDEYGPDVLAVPASTGANVYTFGVPVITAIDPGAGPIDGGNTVEIIGSGFENPNFSLDTVSFDYGDDDSLPAGDPQVISDTEIDVTAPDATAATGNASALPTALDVEFDDLNDPNSSTTVPAAPADADAADYDFGAPVVDSIDPETGALAGGNTIQIMGSGFQNPDLSLNGVIFNYGPDDSGTSLPGTNVQVVSDNEIDVTAPDATAAAGSAGNLDTEVVAQFSDAVDPSDTDVISSQPTTAGADDYTFGAPEIDSITPAAGPLDGGSVVTITGSGFQNSDLTFLGVTFTPEGTTQKLVGLNPDVVSDTEIDVTVPSSAPVADGATALDADVTAEFDVNGSSVATNDSVPGSAGDNVYSYGAPVVNSITPGGGSLNGGDTIKIIGSGFQNPKLTFAGVTFTLDGIDMPPIDGSDAYVVSDTEIDVTTPDVSGDVDNAQSASSEVIAQFNETSDPNQSDDTSRPPCSMTRTNSVLRSSIPSRLPTVRSRVATRSRSPAQASPTRTLTSSASPSRPRHPALPRSTESVRTWSPTPRSR
jgi:hypothetical protein